MKHVLFLDDDFRRTDEFSARMRVQPCTLVTVTTVEECIVRLDERSYDLVLLDHDLGGETFVDSARDDTGMEVVRWLKGNPGDHAGFLVHSMNAVAAAAMYFELSAMGYPVHQAAFGSPAFYAIVYRLLEIEASSERGPRLTLAERMRRYMRSLRGG